MYPLHTNKRLCNTVDVGKERSKTHKRVEKPTVHAKKPQSQTKQSTAVKQRSARQHSQQHSFMLQHIVVDGD